ncbi:MAG: hypothetical protein KF805_12605 [Phycisphaeraceae bacterium]|nr:hypothetical protein [Phycisphaeraceae bacterium]
MKDDIVIDPIGDLFVRAVALLTNVEKDAMAGEGWQVVYQFGAIQDAERLPQLVDDACGFAPLSVRWYLYAAMLCNMRDLLKVSALENAARRNHFLNPSVHSLHALNVAMEQSSIVGEKFREYIKRCEILNGLSHRETLP